MESNTFKYKHCFFSLKSLNVWNLYAKITNARNNFYYFKD